MCCVDWVQWTFLINEHRIINVRTEAILLKDSKQPTVHLELEMSPMMGPVVLVSTWFLLCGKLHSTEARVFNPVLFFQKSFQDLEVQAEANPCCYPTQFRANIYGIAVGPEPGTEYNGSMNVDGKKMRAATKITVDNPEEGPLSARQVVLFNPINKTAIFYFINDAAQLCMFDTVNATFDQVIDPCFNGATFAGDSTIGFKDWTSDSLKVKSCVRNDTPTATHTRVVSARYCAPILESFELSPKPHNPIAYQANYYTDVTSKLDESAFLIPKFCNPKYGMETREGFDRILKTFPQAFLYNINN